jgi:hypothetical protein
MAAELATERAFGNGREHLEEELRLLDLRIASLVRQQEPRHRFSGLVIGDGEVRELLAGPARVLAPPRTPDGLASVEADIVSSAQAAADRGAFLPLLELAVRFGLDRLEQRLLVVCLAEQVDRKYGKLYAFINDDVTARRPTVGLALELVCGSHEEWLRGLESIGRESALRRYGLVHIRDDAEPMIRRVLSLDDRVVDYLLQIPRRDPRMAPPRHFGEVQIDETLPRRLREFFRRHAQPNSAETLNALFYLRGPHGSGARRLAEAACTEHGAALLVARADTLPDAPDAFDAAVLRLVRDATLADAALCLEHCEALLDTQAGRLQRVLDHTRGRLTFFTGSTDWNVRCDLGGRLFSEIVLACPPRAVREASWRATLGTLPSRDVDFARLAARFRFTPEQIEIAANEAASRARWQSPGAEVLDGQLLQEVCRAHSTPRLGALAQHVSACSSWKDLVLTADAGRQLRELCDHARFRDVVFGDWGFEGRMRLGRGLNALFCGPPGSGKTLAAEVIATELECDLYRIDLSQVVSKYIGETEKQLRQVFDEAQGSDAILFFDEADALFGKRSEVKDAHDRYANIEIGYLLQRMDEYDGIAILATNMRRSLDDAFTRRLRFMVEFLFPEAHERQLIWQAHFTRDLPQAGDLDLEFLAGFKLSGASIRNAVLAAAFQAASERQSLGMRHVVRAVRREFQKLGRTCSAGEFGAYGGMLEEVAT